MRATEILTTFIRGGGSGAPAVHNQPQTPLGIVVALVRIVRAAVLIVNSLWTAFSYSCFYALLRPTLGLVSPALFWRVEEVMFQTGLAVVASWMFIGDVEVIETTETDAVYEEPCIVLANHQETGDVAVLMTAAVGNGIAGRMTWIMDALFKYTQFGLVSAGHGDLFVQEGRNTRDASVKEINRLLRRRFASRRRLWCVIFPEGGLLWKRRAGSQKYARERGLPVLNNVALPRLGAFKATMDAIGRDVRSIVDITIGYKKDRPLTMIDVLTASLGRYPVHLHYRRFDISTVPTDDEGMTTWLYDRFVEKEKLLEDFYATGSFDSAASPQPSSSAASASHARRNSGPKAGTGRRERLLAIPPWYLVGIQLFWASTAFGFYTGLRTAISAMAF